MNVVVTITVTCRDHAIARKVMTDYFPSLDTLLEAPGITGVAANYCVNPTKLGDNDEPSTDAPGR